jgi:hypothetical protein
METVCSKSFHRHGYPLVPAPSIERTLSTKLRLLPVAALGLTTYWLGSGKSSWSVTREKNAMNININKKRKFSINGKEYNSVEEMSHDIRENFKKTTASQTGMGHELSRAAVRTKIVLNGTEYDSVDAIPQDVRRLYENVLKGAEDGAVPPEIDMTGIYHGIMTGSRTPETARTGELRRPAKIESSFSPRALIAGILAAALLLLLYYLVQGR